MAHFFGNGNQPLAPHAPAYAREYTQTLFVGHAKKCKVPWRLPGTVWLWSCQPDFVEVGAPRLDLDPAACGGADWPGGKIPIVFPPREATGFKTVDVVVSAAPPEFTNARKYLLRFHLTYIDPTSHRDEPEAVTAGEVAARTATKARLDELERLATTERLVALNHECAELRAQRLGTPAALYAQSVAGSQASAEIAELREELNSLNGVLRDRFLGDGAHAPVQQYAPYAAPHPAPQPQPQPQQQPQPPQQPQQQQQRFFEASHDPYASVVSHAGSLASRATTKRRKPKATPMKNGWYAAYDYSVARPYYFQPNSGVVQWQPPPGQPACLISYGKSPHQNAAPQPMHQVFRNDRAAMLESPAPSEIGD